MGSEKKGLSTKAETCFGNCATALKKIFSEAVGFPKSMQQGNCFVKKIWSEKKGLSTKAETCFGNCATALKKIFSEAVRFPKSTHQGNCFVKKNMVRKKKVL